MDNGGGIGVVETPTGVAPALSTRKLKIAILIPFYKFMDAAAVQSLLGMLSDITNKGDVYIPVMCNSIYIGLARETLFATVAREVPDADYVLCIDTDHIYSAKALYRLVDHMEADKSLEMLSAAYHARGMPNHWAHCNLNEKGEYKKILSADTKGIVDCDGLGFGFNLLKMHLVKRMLALNVELFASKSEDLYFCKVAKEKGVRIAFDADTRVGHISQVVI